MVFIISRNGLDSNKDMSIILNDSNIDLSDDRCDDLHFIQIFFQMSYDHLNGRDI